MSSFQIKNLSKYINLKEEKFINNKKDIIQIKEKTYNTINNMKIFIYKNFDNSLSKVIKDYFSQITHIFEILFYSLNTLIKSKNEIEILQRKDEYTIRHLYANYFHQKLINEIFENQLQISKRIEKENELLKQKTGAIIDNGKIIYNNRKENEIIILRTENSLLKTTIKNNEDLINEKNDIINNLKSEISLYKSVIDELKKIKNGEYSSFSNINININDPKPNYKKKIINSNHKSPINSLQINSSASYKNKNCPKNIYSSYKINSHLINSYKKNINKDFFKNDKSISITRNRNSNDIVDIKNNTYSSKYISVKKNITFSPHKTLKINSNINNKYNKKQSQIKYKHINSKNIPEYENKIITSDNHKKNEIKGKKTPINKKFLINHRKANSIQLVEKGSLKRLNNNRKSQKSLSNDSNKSNNLVSVLRKISEIRNKNLKKNTASLLTNTFTNDSKKIKPITDRYGGKSLNYTMEAYVDKKNFYKGRNEKNYNNTKISVDSIKDYSLSFMNKTTYDNNSNNN